RGRAHHRRRRPLPPGRARDRDRPPAAQDTHPRRSRLTAVGAPRHLALVGATASGKSALALEVARRLGDVELVSVDSMQVYRGLDVGTAKPSAAEQREVPHHLLDLADPAEDFSMARFQAAAGEAIAAIEARGHRVLLVGGTGLYVRAVVDRLTVPGEWPEVRAELDAEAAATGTEGLHRRLAAADPPAAARIDPAILRRLVRALAASMGRWRDTH